MTGTADIVVAMITAGFMLVGNLAISLVTLKKQSSLIRYRIEQLEKKQDVHNGYIKRMYKVEEQVRQHGDWLSDLEKKVH